MNKRIKQMWIAALKSGKYKQGKNKLKNINNEFCCLGVLCDILKEELDIEWEVIEGNTAYLFNSSAYNLTDNELNYSKLSVDITNELIIMNDKKYKTFNEIADWIEGNIT